MRIVTIAVLLCGLALAGRPETTRGAIEDWPLQGAREVRLDLDVMVAAVTPEGEESSEICILGPIQRLGPAHRGVKLPKHWLWIAEAQPGFDFSMIPALKEADVPGLSIFLGQDLRDTKPLAALKSLRYLSLENFKLPWKALKGWRGNPKLETLLLQDTDIGEAGLKEIAKRTSLRQLQLKGEDIGDKGVRELAALTSMERLYLHHCVNVTEAGLTPMLDAMPGLRTLGLRRTQVRGSNLAQIGKLGQLERLDLAMCGWFTDAGLAHLHGCKKTTQLHLDGCRQLTPAAVERLRKALSNAWIGDPRRGVIGGPVPARPFPR